MKNKLFYLCLIGFLFACQQEKDLSGEITNPRNPENQLESFLKIDSTQFTVRVDEVITYSFAEMTAYDLMIDGDNIADLRFSISGEDQPLGTYIREIKVETISEETTIGVATAAARLCSFQETTTEGEVKFVENYNANRTYNGTLDIEDPIDIVSPAVFRQGDEIDHQAGFDRGEFLLTYRDATKELNPNPEWSIHYDIEYGNWNGVEDGFLVVQMQKEEKNYYVWLKMKIVDFEQLQLLVYRLKEVRG